MKTGFSSLLALSAFGLLSFAGVSSASTLASDNASNATYSGGTFNGLNGGTGFLAWSVTGSGTNNGSYVGTTGQGATSFGIYAADANSSANAIRPFNGALTAGQTFSVRLGNTTVASGGLAGLSLQNSSSATAINLQTDGTNWSLNSGSGNVVIGTDTANTSYVFTLTYNGGSSYSYTLTGAAGGTNLTATNTISGITQANFFDFQQGSNQNFGFNNLAIVPEPSAWSAMLLGGIGTLLVVRRRRIFAR